MLTADLVKPRLRAKGNDLHINMLTNTAEPTARDLIRLFTRHIGKTTAEWEQSLTRYEDDRLDYILIRSLAKVLTDDATIQPDSSPVDPAELRQTIFKAGPVFEQRDVFYPHTRADVLQQVAEQYDLPPETLETLLYADLRYRIVDGGHDWTPHQLIQRYNLELARAALYWSDHMTIHIYDTFKDFWRYLKLFKLMFEAQPIENGYRVELDGPISPFVSATTRYGRQFAAFLPALFLCQHWQMEANVKPPMFDRPLTYRLNDQVPLVSHFQRSPPYDSRMEADFAAEFYAKFGNKRGKWTLTREDEVILLGDTVMIPDFTLTHKEDGTRILVEIVGFWHPNYLRRKLAKARQAGRDDLLLLVYEGVNLTPDDVSDLPALFFKNKPVLKDVLARAEAMRTK